MCKVYLGVLFKCGEYIWWGILWLYLYCLWCIKFKVNNVCLFGRRVVEIGGNYCDLDSGFFDKIEWIKLI